MLTGAGKVPRFERVGFGKATEINRRVIPYWHEAMRQPVEQVKVC